jgi:hypothetical protein
MCWPWFPSVLTAQGLPCCPEKSNERFVADRYLKEYSMSVQTLIGLAKAEAKRLQRAGGSAGVEQPALQAAVAQTWALLLPRLGQGEAVHELDRLIRSLVGGQADSTIREP